MEVALPSGSCRALSASLSTPPGREASPGAGLIAKASLAVDSKLDVGAHPPRTKRNQLPRGTSMLGLHRTVSMPQRRLPGTPIVRAAGVRRWSDVPTGSLIDVCAFDVRQSVPKSSYEVKVFERMLKSHPDRQFVGKVVRQLVHGSPLNYDGPREVFVNCPDCSAEDVGPLREEMLAGVVRGWYLGPFTRPPFPNSWCADQTRCVPLFCIPKSKWTPEDGKMRTISNYSFECAGVPSVNGATRRDEPQMEYFQAQGISKAIIRAGQGCLVYCWDVPSAYKTLFTQPSDWSQCCFRLGDEFFVSMVNDFGSVHAGDEWHRFALAIQFILGQTAAPKPKFYVDNFFHFFSNSMPSHEADRLVGVIRSTTDELGVRRHEEQYGSKFDALGWHWDTASMCVALKPERRRLVLRVLKDATTDKFTLGKLNSLIGVLFHLSRVLPEGRAFLGRCIAVQTSAKRAHRRKQSAVSGTKLMLDVRFWIATVPTIPSRRLLFDAEWTNGEDVRVYTDASSWGYGAVNITNSQYVYGPWPEHILEKSRRAQALSMPWLEMLAVVMAARTWAPNWAGKRVLALVDCQPAVLAINKNYSADCRMLNLLRNLNTLSIAHAFVIRADRVAGAFNELADPLSRNQLQEFLDRCSTQFSMATPPSSAILAY